MFSAERSAQIAAEFGRREGGSINILKLVKLIYLADRRSMEWTGLPITYDVLVSMDLGPAPSVTYDLMKKNDAHNEDWAKWIQGRNNHDVIVRHRNFTRKDLGELSETDIKVIDDIWERFGNMNEWELSEYTHKKCPEWKCPSGSSRPIQEREIFESLGWSKADAMEAEEAIRDQRDLDKQFATA